MVENACFTCLSSCPDGIDLNTTLKFQQHSCSDMLKDLCPSVQFDGFKMESCLICTKCQNLLTVAYEFKKQVESAQTCLKESLKDVDTSVKYDEEFDHILSSDLRENLKEESNDADTHDRKLFTDSPQLSPESVIESDANKRENKKRLARKCGLCDIQFANMKEYHKHVADSHPDYSCIHCGKHFKKFWSLTFHLKSHQEKTHLCSYCGRKFALPGNLLQHLKLHQNIKPFQCVHCQKRFPEHNQLRDHILVNHTEEKKYGCELCAKRFPTDRQLRRHLKTHEKDPNRVRQHVCSICGRGFLRKSYLKEHVFAHSDQKRFSCDICNRAFTFRKGLSAHKLTHLDELPFKCSLCSRSFTQKHSLRTHCLNHHSNVNEDIKELRADEEKLILIKIDPVQYDN